MIITGQIIDAINKILSEKYPVITVYLNSCPKDFSRPSFCVKTVKVIERPANRNTVKIRARFSVTYFTKVDESGNVNAENLVEIQASIMSVFRKGFINVGDRQLKVMAKNYGIYVDSACVYLRFDYFDNRIDETGNASLMEEVNFELNEEE